MKLVQQTTFGGCGIACLAMVLGLTIEEVLEDLQGIVKGGADARQDGLLYEEMVEALQRRGLADARVDPVWFDWRPAILVVPSLNHRGRWHYIVWDGKQYLDPSPGPLRYPADAPVVGGQRHVCYGLAIIWGPIPRE